MAGNTNLCAAKAAKNDEFYTQWNDIENEMQAYLEYNPDVFRGKTVLLPCDDPAWSNFTKYFALNFEKFGLEKLISTSCAPRFNPDADKRGRIYVLERGEGASEGGRLSKEDLKWDYLEGDGDFRSDEVTKLRDEADIVVTNPPFSLFREFFAWLVDGDVQFSIIGNKSAIIHKGIFSLIKENLLWMGKASMSQDMLFNVPEAAKVELMKKREGSAWRRVDGEVYARAAACWFTNIEHGHCHEPLSLMTMERNLLCGSKRVREVAYPKYDNYDAIEVPETKGIPSDYPNVMGVPISFLDKYNPEQFEIVGMPKRGAVDQALKTRVYTAEDYPNYSGLNSGPVIIENGTPRNTYARIFIRHRNPEREESQPLSRTRSGQSSLRCKRGLSHVEVRG